MNVEVNNCCQIFRMFTTCKQYKTVHLRIIRLDLYSGKYKLELSLI